MDVQCITAHSLSGIEVEYYLLHNGAATYPVSMIKKVHISIPFTKDDMRVIDPDDTTAIPISTTVSSIIVWYTLWLMYKFKEWDRLMVENNWKKASRGTVW